MRTLSASEATVSTNRDGKVAERAGEPEDLPCHIARVPRPQKNIPFLCGFALRPTEMEQLIIKGQVNWVQPFKPSTLEGFFILLLKFN